jgi:PD-(D/E)XK nuclease superfamily
MGLDAGAEGDRVEERERIFQITERIIGAAIRVHKALGPGLLESAYEACLEHELKDDGLTVERQKPLRLEYRGVQLDCAYRLWIAPTAWTCSSRMRS